MSNQTDLDAVEAAIAQTLKGQKWEHGDDKVEMPDLKTLYAQQKILKTRINRRRGIRGRGFQPCH